MRPLLILALASGCSAIGVRGPATSHVSGGCTTSRVLPIGDLVLGAPLSAVGILSLVDGVQADPAADSHNASFGGRAATLGLGAVTLALGVPLFASAMHGFANVNRCARAHAWEAQRTP